LILITDSGYRAYWEEKTAEGITEVAFLEMYEKIIKPVLDL
jgi:hypothetical protein